MAPQVSLPDLPGLKIRLPGSFLFQEATMFAKDHCDEPVYNHAVRCAYWALLIYQSTLESAKQPIDIDLVVLVCILHDLGLAYGRSDALGGLSPDKRFEVDGANIGRDFVMAHTGDAQNWDAARLDRLWMAIALHTTPSIALHANPEVALANQAISADFAGPHWSPNGEKGPITMEEYHIVVNAFPRGNFNREGLKRIACGLCQSKPETTYDNFVGIFGRDFGYDGKGLGREEYTQSWEDNQVAESLLRGLDALDQLDASF